MNPPAPRTRHRDLVLLGSNIDPGENLPLALARLGEEFEVVAASAVYVSPPVGAEGTPDFHNQAVVIGSDLAPDELRTRFHAIEADLGRVRTEDRNAPRVIDIDHVARFDEQWVALPAPPVDPHLTIHHHLAHPCAEVLPLARLSARGPCLTDVARDLGATPHGFRRVPTH